MSRVAVVAIIAAGAIALPAGASAATAVPTKVTIDGFTYKPGPDLVTFHGRVQCRKPCKPGRKVTLRQITDKILVGTTRTNERGRWRISFTGDDVPPNKFKARAAAKRVTVKKDGRTTTFRCKPGASKVFLPEAS